MNDKLITVNPPSIQAADPILAAKTTERAIQGTNEKKPPRLGITLVRLKGNFSLDDFFKQAKKNPDAHLYEELENLRDEMRKCQNMDEFLEKFHTKTKEMNPDDNAVLKKAVHEAQDIVRRFNLEEDDFRENFKHIHSQPNGNGKFVLFGYVYSNIFEVVLLDTNHEISAYTKSGRKRKEKTGRRIHKKG